MKVNSYTKCETPQNSSSELACTSLKPACQQVNRSYDVDSSSCHDTYGRAMVAMQGAKKPKTKEEVAALVNKIIENTGMQIGRHINDKHIHIGRPVEGFKNLCYDDMRAKCLRDNDGFVDSIYLLDNKTGDVKIYDAEANLKKHFTQSDMKALKEYKYTVDELHNYLRHGKIRGISTQETLKDIVTTLDNLFNDESKVFRTEKDMVLYRALQPDLSERQKDVLTTLGGIYSDNSFVSTSTELNVAERFRSVDNPILKIEVPKGTKYLDMDALFNIDRQHWNEKEYLLNRNSRFEVTGFDVLNNIIKVKYLG